MKSGKKAITKKEQVEANNDPRIDQDVPGFPHHPSSEEDIKKKPATKPAIKKSTPKSKAIKKP